MFYLQIKEDFRLVELEQLKSKARLYSLLPKVADKIITALKELQSFFFIVSYSRGKVIVFELDQLCIKHCIVERFV